MTEEVYSGGGANIFTRAVVTAKYKDYKFFTVETPTEVSEPERLSPAGGLAAVRFFIPDPPVLQLSGRP